ncbi:hypothetical protein HMPREF9306_01263 [Propionimicrobium lymphophilum ACS-093-V-SCH5]|uniref:Uncharacterized protein n=1 Tax=Propionimicrobium lymphophilum ACS-093-V-SCH5 TaxID=883161 RepID=S2W0V3_9ACTN|nr:hypothetical protein HMPREF9306_01263 [Propionimicrobium lymphophilum ACS-093-V-SCH5]
MMAQLSSALMAQKNGGIMVNAIETTVLLLNGLTALNSGISMEGGIEMMALLLNVLMATRNGGSTGNPRE